MFGWLWSKEKPKIDTGNFHKPEFYRGSDGPEFKVLETKLEDYEVRLYAKSHWAATSASQLNDYSTATNGMFWKLFNYIRGNNEEEKKIEMTIPVKTRVDLDDNAKCKGVTMAFFIPSKLHANPPVPKDKEVFNLEEEGAVMYAKAFGGFAKEKDWENHLQNLKDSLERDGKHYSKDLYYAAGYDPPYRLFGRRNEVLLVADPQPSLDGYQVDNKDETVAE